MAQTRSGSGRSAVTAGVAINKRSRVAGFVVLGVVAASGLFLLSSRAGQSPNWEGNWAVRQPPFPAPPIVFIVFDELPTASLMNRRGHIDGGLFPSFARLATDATWYRNATTIGGYTKQALPALLTGKSHHKGDRPPIQSDHPHTIFSLLGGTYEVRTNDVLPTICGLNLCAPRGEVDPADPLRQSLGLFGSGDRGSHFLSFLDLLEPTPHPSL